MFTNPEVLVFRVNLCRCVFCVLRLNFVYNPHVLMLVCCRCFCVVNMHMLESRALYK